MRLHFMAMEVSSPSEVSQFEGVSALRASTPVGAVAFAASAGGLIPLLTVLATLPADFPAAVLVVLHRSIHSRLHEYLDARVPMPVREAMDGEPVRPGVVLVAPTGIHLTVDPSRRVRLLDDPPVRHIRPAADRLFVTLAAAYGPASVGVILSGMLDDGTLGSRAIRAAGGLMLAQDPRESEWPDMPVSARDVGKVDVVLRVDQIGPALRALIA